MNTAFRKDQTLQGCTTLPARDDRLHYHLPPFRGVLVEVWSPTTFTLRRPNPWAPPKVLTHLIAGLLQGGTYSCESGLLYQRIRLRQPRPPVLYVCTAWQTFLMQYGKWKARTKYAHGEGLSKLVSLKEAHTSQRVVVRSSWIQELELGS